MRGLRVLYIAAMAAFYLAARLTGRREFFLLLFILAITLLCAFLLNLWTSLSFSFTQEISAPTSVKGQGRRLRIGIFNDKPIPFNMMRVKVETVSPREEILLSFNLPPRDSVHFDIPLHCPYRGLYRVGMTRLEMNDLFGLTRLSYDMRILPYYRQRELKIFPRVVELPFLPAGSRDPRQAAGGRRRVAEEGDAYSDSRAYRPGDPAKRIHWKQAMRRGELYTKQYEEPMETGVVLALDGVPASLEGETVRLWADLACECAAAIALYSLRAGHPVRLQDHRPGSRPVRAEELRHFQAVSEWLAALPMEQEGDLAAALRAQQIRGEGTLYALTGSPSPALREQLLALQAGGCAVTCLLLAPELCGGGTDIPGLRCLSIAYGADVADLSR